MFEALFHTVSAEEKSRAVESIIQRASPRADFFLMIMLASAMAAMSIVTDNLVVLVGSMLIAPILYPLLSFSLGIVMGDARLLGRSAYTVLKSTGLALVASFVIGAFFTGGDLASISIVNGSVPTLAFAIVASIAGFAAAFATTKSTLNETLPGVAISVSLVPPLTVAGIGLAHFEWSIFANGFLLFATNVAGIVLFAVVAFSLFGFSARSQVRAAQEAEREEEKVIRKEEAAASPRPAA